MILGRYHRSIIYKIAVDLDCNMCDNVYMINQERNNGKNE